MTTSISVVHSPCAGIRTLKVRPSSSNVARSLAVIAVARPNVPRVVAERELASLDLRRVRALLAQRVLHLEEVREVATRVDPNLSETALSA